MDTVTESLSLPQLPNGYDNLTHYSTPSPFPLTQDALANLLAVPEVIPGYFQTGIALPIIGSIDTGHFFVLNVPHYLGACYQCVDSIQPS